MEMRAIATRHVAKEIKIIVKVSDINRDTLIQDMHIVLRIQRLLLHASKCIRLTMHELGFVT